MTLFVSVAAPDLHCLLESVAAAPLGPPIVQVLALGHGRTLAHSSLPDRHTSLSFLFAP
jgi:hypothetical protein